jgi:hypothetical protein
VLNGTTLPAGYGFSYTLTGPSTYTDGTGDTFSVPPGTYTLSFNAGYGLTLASITPSATQIVSAGGQVTFTLSFTAPNDFSGPYFAFPPGGSTTQIVPSGTPATFYVDLAYGSNPATPVNLQAIGLPATATTSFDPQPSYGSSTLTVTTPGTSPGIYTLSLTATDSSGLVHAGTNTAALVVTAPPSSPTQLVSVSSGSVQGNAPSWFPYSGSVSGDGRYVAFYSQATNLTSDANNDGSVFVRDMQAQTTALASLDQNGSPFLSTLGGIISANGQYVAFMGSSQSFSGVYRRDLQMGMTEREDIASDGTLGNSSFPVPRGVSADGRFVLFSSDATNLVPGTSSGTPQQMYLRDNTAGTTALVSAAPDGTPANQSCTVAAMSADGRYIAFSSMATNLVSLNLNGTAQVFLRDMQAGQTTIVSLASDGTVANQSVSNTYGMAISADGRFVAFTSSATNLAPAATDGSMHLFLWDQQSRQTTVVDQDANGALSSGSTAWPSISADGRFVTFVAYSEVLIRDMTSDETMAVSLAPDGTAGNAYPTFPAISPGGTAIAFGSASTNLVATDTNGVSDAFLVSNPFLGPSHLQSVTLSSSSAPGGSSLTGTVTLSAAAPTGGASVTVSANNAAADAPAIAFVPEGSTAGTFTIGTSLVPSETGPCRL